MHDAYLKAIEDLANNGYAVIDHFLSPGDTSVLLDLAQKQFEKGEFKKAGVGTAHLYTVNKDVRGDYLLWLELDKDQSPLAPYKKAIDELITALNRGAFLGIKDVEMHFAHYPPGTHYEKHVDGLKINGKRVISSVFYLNTLSQPTGGGALRIYEDCQTKFVDIYPKAGRLVLFLSDSVWHEVLRVNKERYSITGWMLNQYTDTTFVGA